jgi:membrane protein DedA with SNARE-associated domain/membrane-associated phospholipid phosphatase
MLDRLIDLAGFVGPWGYLVFFLIVALECQAIVGLFMPGESLVLFGGFLAGQGVYDPVLLVAVISLAAILGDSVGYELGRTLGLDWLLRHGRRLGIRQAQLDRVSGFIGRHGGKAVFVSHFTHLMRALMPFFAGASRMRYRRFLLFNAAGCVAWAAAFVALGALAGASWRVVAKWAGRAGEIVGGAILLAIALAWGWRWLLRHEDDVIRRWRALVDHPKTVALRRRLEPQLAFLRSRFSPGNFMGLELTLGVLLLVAASWLFGGIAEDVVEGDPLTVVDQSVALWLHARTTPDLILLMKGVTALASPAGVIGIATVSALVLLWRRRWIRLLALVLVLPGGMLLDLLLKTAFHRSRPVFEDPVQIFSGYSFPSGHTMAATLLYGLLAAFAVASLRSWRWRIRSVLVAIVLVLLVAFSRMYLGAHYLSDVLGAIAAGIAWLALCLTAVDTYRRYR